MTGFALGCTQSQRWGHIGAAGDRLGPDCHRAVSRSQVSGVTPGGSCMRWDLSPQVSGTGRKVFLGDARQHECSCSKTTRMFLQEDKDHLIPMPLN